MAKATTSILRLVCLLVCVVICRTEYNILHPTNFKWCVARTNASLGDLQKYIKETCAKRTCTSIEPGGHCYVRTTLCNSRKKVATKHASYLLNWDYKKTYLCLPTSLAEITYDNPKYGRCGFP